MDAQPRLSLVASLEGDGGKAFQSACSLGLEGIVSKRMESGYRPGRSHDWFKIKCEVSETFAIVGYRQDDNDRIEGLYLGRADGETWRYAGQVEDGIGADDMEELERRLPSLVTRRPPLIDKPRGKNGAKWTRPEIFVEVVYPNRTDDGRLRHPRFKGIRDDMVASGSKQPRAV